MKLKSKYDRIQKVTLALSYSILYALILGFIWIIRPEIPFIGFIPDIIPIFFNFLLGPIYGVTIGALGSLLAYLSLYKYPSWLFGIAYLIIGCVVGYAPTFLRKRRHILVNFFFMTIFFGIYYFFLILFTTGLIPTSDIVYLVIKNSLYYSVVVLITKFIYDKTFLKKSKKKKMS